MSTPLRVALILLSIAFLIAVIFLVRRGRLQLKYSMLWMGLGILLIICALFPEIVSFFSHLLGFVLPVNFVFFVGLMGLLAICLSLSVIVSWQARDIRHLVQDVALLKKKAESNSSNDQNKLL